MQLHVDRSQSHKHVVYILRYPETMANADKVCRSRLRLTATLLVLFRLIAVLHSHCDCKAVNIYMMIYLFEEKLAKSQNTCTARASYFWDIFHTSSHEIT